MREGILHHQIATGFARVSGLGWLVHGGGVEVLKHGGYVQPEGPEALTLGALEGPERGSSLVSMA